MGQPIATCGQIIAAPFQIAAEKIKDSKALKITLLVVGILAVLGTAYALTGHFVGFATMNQAIAHGFGTAAGGIKHFYTHLNAWKGIVGIGIPAALLLTTAALLGYRQLSKGQEELASKAFSDTDWLPVSTRAAGHVRREEQEERIEEEEEVEDNGGGNRAQENQGSTVVKVVTVVAKGVALFGASVLLFLFATNKR